MAWIGRLHWPPRPPRVTAVAGVVVLAGAMVVAGCAGESGGGGSTQRQQTLIVAENEPPASFDPVQADNSTVDEVVIPAYDALVQYDRSGKLTPQLATSWKIAPDAKSISFELRDNVTFHDGTKLTANDVKYTLDRIKKLNVGVASQLQAYASTDVIDDTHLTIRLSQPYAPFVPALSRVYVLNSKLVQEHAGNDDGKSWLANHTAGSGPYQLVSYQPNSEAVFTRFDRYWGGFTKQAKKVIFRYLPEAATQRDALKQGDVDIAMDIDPLDVKALAGDHTFTVDKADTLVQLYIFFKMKDSPTANAKVREAIASAYNYASHIQDILYGAGKPVTGPLPAAMACYDPSATQPTYDLDRARRLIAESGVGKISLTLTYLPAIQEMKRAATLLQSALREIGVDLTLKGITFPAYVDMIKKNETTPDLGMIYAFPAYPDPDAVLSINFDSKFIGNGYNYGGYANPAYDQLVRKAQGLADEQQRCQLYQQAQRILVKDLPAMALSNPQYVTVLRSDISGYTYRPAHHQTVDVYDIQLNR